MDQDQGRDLEEGHHLEYHIRYLHIYSKLKDQDQKEPGNHILNRDIRRNHVLSNKFYLFDTKFPQHKPKAIYMFLYILFEAHKEGVL